MPVPSKVSKAPSTPIKSKHRLIVSSVKKYNDIITVKVGEEAEEFSVHRELLFQHSSVFRGMVKNTSKEADTKTLQLPDVQVAIFQVYFTWLYSNYNLPDNLLVEDIGKRLRLANLWIFSNNESPLMPGPKFIKHVYCNPSRGASIRKLLVDYIVEVGDKDVLFNPATDRAVPWDAEFCQEVLYGLTCAYKGPKRTAELKKQWEDRDEREYHIHNPDFVVKEEPASGPATLNPSNTAITTAGTPGDPIDLE